MTQREAFLWYAEQFIGRPYVWGGDDPLAGFDCSGLIVECGTAVGIYTGDDTARGLYARAKPLAAPGLPGDLVFWGRQANAPDSIEHVEIVWRKVGPLYLSLGASGGGAAVVTVEDAIRQNAYVKVRPIRAGQRFLYFADPFA